MFKTLHVKHGLVRTFLWGKQKPHFEGMIMNSFSQMFRSRGAPANSQTHPCQSSVWFQVNPTGLYWQRIPNADPRGQREHHPLWIDSTRISCPKRSRSSMEKNNVKKMGRQALLDDTSIYSHQSMHCDIHTIVINPFMRIYTIHGT